jgi:hypothetical protein
MINNPNPNTYSYIEGYIFILHYTKINEES